MDHLLLLFPALCLLLLAGCEVVDLSETTHEADVSLRVDEADLPLIRTDQKAYVVHAIEEERLGRVLELDIEVRYANKSSRTSYLPTCRSVNPPYLEKWIDGAWVVAFSPTVPDCLGPPVIVTVGETYTYPYQIRAYSGGLNPAFAVDDIDGTYRLVWEIYQTWAPNGSEPGLGALLPLTLRVSNTFHLSE